MAEEVGALNAELAAKGLPRIGIRIGVQTGPMTAGSLGRSAHLEYALMGDAVNTAARLEAYAKTLRGQGAPACTILVGAATRARLGPEVALRPVGEVGLRGKEEKVGVFEVVAASAAAPQDTVAYGRVGDATL
jgi:adenylate cyclase